MINSACATSGPLLDAAYARLGMPPTHAVTRDVIEGETAELRLYDYYFASNPEVERSLLALDVRPEQILRTSFGWRPERFDLDAPVERGPGSGPCSSAGSACARACPSCWRPGRPSTSTGELVLVGAVDDEIRELVDAHARSGRVRLAGYVENPAALYSGSDVFVFPTWEEGGPQVTYEAAACGLPVVTTPMGAARLVEDGRTGVVVEPGSVAQIACGDPAAGRGRRDPARPTQRPRGRPPTGSRTAGSALSAPSCSAGRFTPVPAADARRWSARGTTPVDVRRGGPPSSTRSRSAARPAARRDVFPRGAVARRARGRTAPGADRRPRGPAARSGRGDGTRPRLPGGARLEDLDRGEHADPDQDPDHRQRADLAAVDVEIDGAAGTTAVVIRSDGATPSCRPASSASMRSMSCARRTRTTSAVGPLTWTSSTWRGYTRDHWPPWSGKLDLRPVEDALADDRRRGVGHLVPRRVPVHALRDGAGGDDEVAGGGAQGVGVDRAGGRQERDLRVGPVGALGGDGDVAGEQADEDGTEQHVPPAHERLERVPDRHRPPPPRHLVESGTRTRAGPLGDRMKIS